MNVLVLCHGNICRSPLVAAVLTRAGCFNVRSAGLKPREGSPAAKKMRAFAATKGLDLSQHRSRLVTVGDLLWANRILIMDNGNERCLQERFPGTQYTKLGDFTGVDRIPDPNFLTGDAFNKAAEIAYVAAVQFCEDRGHA